MSETETEQKSIFVSGYGNGMISLGGLTAQELEKIQGSIRGGMWWIRVVNGRLVAVSNYQELPGPVSDDSMYPFWRTPTPGEKAWSAKLFPDLDRAISEHSSPSITIQHLCGYGYTPENYKREAMKLESWGFECLRSRRKDDAQFWEIWYLPGLWSAKGALETELYAIKDQKKKLEIALSFLQKYASFGSLDVSAQRMAMVHSDAMD